MAVVVLLITALTAVAHAQGISQRTATLAGVVRDDSASALPGATVTVRSADRRARVVATSDSNGRYHADRLTPGIYTVEIALLNFGTRRFTGVQLVADQMRTLDATLSLAITADVSVTATRTFRNLAELEFPVGGLIGIANSASEGLVTGRQLDARPIMRTGEILEAVPGLVISQHSGEGKANQYYLRGFNLDHGTDFATTVAGLPVNMPTHAHGQGYSDVNFLIPELVSVVQFQKGLYSAEQGDFSTAGASHVRYANVLERPIARVSTGQDGWRRVLGAASPRVGAGHVLLAIESTHNNGPWVRPDDYQKLNAVVGYSRGDVRNGFALNAMAYRGTWDATDQAPARAIASGALTRFDGVDPTSGGDTARYSLSTDWQQTRGRGVTRVNAFVLRYRLNLFSNFTYFLDDPVNGDQFEQADRRWVAGGRVAHRRLATIGGKSSELVFGGEFRRDAIGEVGLHRTTARRRLSTVREDVVTQSSAGAYVGHEMQWTSWARTNLGLRGDRYWFDVEADNPLNAGSTSAGLFSPKGAVVFGPWCNTELYVSTGTGFHSNDARGTTMTVDPVSGEPVERVTPLARARGAEVGIRSTPRRGLQTTISAWILSLDSELVFVGDAGTTDAGRPSRRFGAELSTLYSPVHWLTLDADLSLSRARFRDDNPAGSRIPGALERVTAGGLTVADRGRFGGSLRLGQFGARDLIEDGSVRSHATTLLNGQLVFRASQRMRVVFDAFNLFDSAASDIDYFYTSRLPGERVGGIEDVHSHPAIPRSLRLGMQIAF